MCQVAKAKEAYREALARQAMLPENERWTMGATIKALKAAAYVEIEASKVRRV